MTQSLCSGSENAGLQVGVGLPHPSPEMSFKKAKSCSRGRQGQIRSLVWGRKMYFMEVPNDVFLSVKFGLRSNSETSVGKVAPHPALSGSGMHVSRPVAMTLRI